MHLFLLDLSQSEKLSGIESPLGLSLELFLGIFISKSDYEMRLRHHINEANWLSGSWLN